ncbi:RmlC-like cupin [Obba rivulosa]|uniref:RmlC-like cupin n=1 Tax=Obba rivulosa TaxID=1052685 RepID=A0A8E2DNE3_9APHY|nr:RmlC-like cupin [Obba rivulosa]
MMFSARSLVLSLVFSAYALAEGAADPGVAQLVAQLRDAPTAVNRLALLQDGDFVFNFLNATTGVTTGAAGHTVAASSSNFPALIDNGMAMTVGFLGPCALNSPHIHTRATEFNYIVSGNVSAGFLAENGARFVFNDILTGQAIIFPKGVIHFEMNNGCDDALFVAVFNDEDPGVNQVAQRFFGLPPDVVSATLGDIGVQNVANLESKIPDNVIFGTQECLQRCGLNGTDNQPTLQRQPRVAANALPSGYSAPSAAPAPTGSSSNSNSLSSDLSGASTNTNSSSGSGKLNTLEIALIAVVGALVAGYIVIGIVLFMRRQKGGPANSGKYSRPGERFAPQGAVFEGEKSSPMPFESFRPSSEGQGDYPSTPYDPPAGSA